MIKNLLYLILLFAGACFFNSCSLLEQESPNDLDAATAIRDAQSAEAAMLGIYSSLQQSAYYGGSYPLMTEPLCNNSSTGGFQVISLDELGSRQVTPANLLVEETWIAIYRVIANANALLAALPNIKDLDDARSRELEGQARALRAMAHFDLLRMYGEHWDLGSRYGIPVIQSVQTIDDRPTRATVDASYTFIIQELEAALELVNAEDLSLQYVQRQTVLALLARVYLYAGNTAKADFYAGEVIDSQNGALLPSDAYGLVFSDRRTSESIFELAYDAQNRSNFNELTYARNDALRTEIFFLASADLETFFQSRPNDVRAALLDYSPDNNDPTILPDGRSQKYRGESTRDNPGYILRLAEMYLIRAEALGRQNGLPFLNTLRQQRGLDALDGAAVPDDGTYQDAILAERRAEFNFEGHYYFDLARTGRFTDATGEEAFRAVLPIPNRELIASGGDIEQNPGY